MEPETTNQERAVRAYAAMQRHFHLGGSVRLYRETVPVARGANHFAYLWPFEEAAKATLCLLGLPDVHWRDVEDIVDRQAYWQPLRSNGLAKRPSYASYPPIPLGHGGDTYYDDNTWVALDLIQAYRMTRALRGREIEAHLDRARLLFDLVAAGWCTDPRPFPGGVYWVDAAWNRDRGAAVTAGLAVLALHLHELRGDDEGEYLETARRAYGWLRDSLLIADGPQAGLYHDKILGDGTIDASQWIYNQGVPIAAGVMLHRVTGEAAYLEQARRTANAALAWYGADDGQRLLSQPAIFVAIFFRNLLQLAAVSDEPAYRAAMRAYTDRVWDDPSLHDPVTDLIHVDRTSPAHTLLDQAAMVQVYALLGWPEVRYGLLA
jgi:hypothetical protein